MLRQITAGIFGIAALGFALPAMAVSSVGVPSVSVNIDVQPIVSMWPNDPSITLTLDGTGQENRAAVASSLSVINNVDANITAAVTGSLPDDILDNVPQLVNAVNFFIFKSGTVAAATAAIIANANAPANALVWTNDNLGASQQLVASTGLNPNITNFPIVYAADAPNVLPAVANWALTVTYTITSN
jgi:hypothetical protein